MSTFRPADHSFGPSHYFEALSVGQKFYINSRTQTDGLAASFQAASGDNHPIHYDRECCKARGHRDMFAHGLQVTIQAAAGAGIFPHHLGDSLIAFLEQSSRFLKPVYVGDTLYPMLEITELKPGREHDRGRRHARDNPQPDWRSGDGRHPQISRAQEADLNGRLQAVERAA